MKRSVRNQAIHGNEITSAKAFFDACTNSSLRIHFEFCTNEEIEEAKEILNHRYENMKVKTIQGTLGYHGYIPVDSQTINAKTFSSSALSKPYVVAIPTN